MSCTDMTKPVYGNRERERERERVNKTSCEQQYEWQKYHQVNYPTKIQEC